MATKTNTKPAPGKSTQQKPTQSKAPPQEERRSVPARQDAAKPPAPSRSSTVGLLAPDEALLSSMPEGEGLSTASEDNLVPLMYVFQPLSPQVDEDDTKHVENAKPGQIWLRGDPEPLVEGDEGVLVQWCGMYSEWVEWIPREAGGGIVSRSPGGPGTAPPEGSEKVEGTMRWKKDGNEMIDTRYVILNVYREGPDSEPVPYVLPLKSTGHSVAKRQMTAMNRRTYKGRKLPVYACIYLLKTAKNKNQKGTWFLPVFENLTDEDGNFAGYATAEQLKAGKALFDAFKMGEKRAAQEEDVDGDLSGDDGDFVPDDGGDEGDSEI